MTTPTSLQQLATALGCTVDEVKGRIVRALQASGIIPMELTEAPPDVEIERRITVNVQMDNQGTPTYYVQSGAGGWWKL